MVHEFTAHRTEASWRCNLCAETFHAQEQFRAHVDSIHNQDFVPSQISEVVTASKRLEAGDGSGEVCPFCLVIPAKTQKAFARHVGRHLQVISLAALPVSEEPTDSDSDNDNDENEKDNDSNEDYDSAGSNESHETAKQPSQSDGLEEIHDIIEQPSQPVGSNESHETTEQSSQSVKQVQNRITVDQRSNKAILSEALQNANTAVLLDNAQNFEGAIRSYSMACDSLDQVKARSSDTEDIRKLNAIVSHLFKKKKKKDRFHNADFSEAEYLCKTRGRA
jgi:uncharacterized C2H2 Zn-finger protein